MLGSYAATVPLKGQHESSSVSPMVLFLGYKELPIMFDLEQKHWCQGTVPYPLYNSAGKTVVFRGKVYGFSVCFPIENPDDCPSNVLTFDPENNNFEFEGNTTDTEIYDQGSAVANNQIYLVGGNAGISAGNKHTEIFDGTSWTVGPQLNNEMGEPAVVEVNGQLWAIGFIDHATKTTAEYLDLKSTLDLQKWQKGPTLPFSSFVSGAVIDNTIYVCENSDAVYIGTGCAKLSIEDDGSFGDWTQVAPLLTPRLAHTIISYNQKLYVLGGVVPKPSFDHSITTVEEYDPKTDKWSAFYNNSLPLKVGIMPYGVQVNVPDSSFNNCQ